MGQSPLCGPARKDASARSLGSLPSSPVLEFLVELRNISIATPLESCFYALTFGGHPKKLVGQARPRASARKPEFTFRYQTSLEDLQSQYLTVQLLAGTGTPRVIARQRIPLASVVTGPPHYDYRLDPPHHRVVMEIAMSQVVNLRFHAAEMLFELDELPDKRVCQASLRLMVS